MVLEGDLCGTQLYRTSAFSAPSSLTNLSVLRTLRRVQISIKVFIRRLIGTEMFFILIHENLSTNSVLGKLVFNFFVVIREICIMRNL